MNVDTFIFLADFVVLDMEEDREISLILGRSLLVTGGALLDVQNRELTLQRNDENVKFNIYNNFKFSEEVHTCHRVNMIESCVKELFHDMWPSDSLEHCLVSSDRMRVRINRMSCVMTTMEYYKKII